MKEPKFVRTIFSDVSEIENLVKDTDCFLKGNNCERRAAVRSVIRELLLNAYEHGNKKNVRKKISFEIELLRNQRCRIQVKDEGCGFNCENTDFSSCTPLEERNKGFLIINSLSDRIQFGNQGASVTVYMTMKKKTKYIVHKEGDVAVVECTGNITAETVDELREILLAEVMEGIRSFKFDMKAVSDIDSLGLSVLIALRNTLAKEDMNFSLEIINANEDCKELFRIIKLDTLYKIY